MFSRAPVSSGGRGGNPASGPRSFPSLWSPVLSGGGAVPLLTLVPGPLLDRGGVPLAREEYPYPRTLLEYPAAPWPGQDTPYPSPQSGPGQEYPLLPQPGPGQVYPHPLQGMPRTGYGASDTPLAFSLRMFYKVICDFTTCIGSGT